MSTGGPVSHHDDPPSFHPRALLSSFVDLIFPPLCQVCGDRSQAAICDGCQSQIKFIERPWCARCGLPFPPLATGVGECAHCRNGKPAYDVARSVGYYDGPLRDALRAFKYRRKVRLSGALAGMLARRFEALRGERDLPAPDCLVPVPLHWRRRWRRGFNQSLLLCRDLARLLDSVPVTELLVRRRATQPQTELRRRARLENLRGAFALRRGTEVAGKHVVVVDDMMTTGATLHECAKVLKRAKCATVVCLTVGRQVRP